MKHSIKILDKICQRCYSYNKSASAGFSFGREGQREESQDHTQSWHPRLKVYPKVILQLTTLSLLFAFSSGAAAVLPAIGTPAVSLSDSGAELVSEIDNSKSLTREIKSEDYMPITDSKNVERFIRDYFKNEPLLAEIARCESRFRQYDSRGEVLRGEENKSDRGVMQINLYYHGETAKKLGLDVHNIDDNVAYAKYLFEKQGSRPWNSSKPCWGKHVGTAIALR